MSPAAERTSGKASKMGGKEFEEAFKPKGGVVSHGKLADEKIILKKKKKKPGLLKTLIILVVIIILLGAAGAALYLSGILTPVLSSFGIQTPSVSAGPSIEEQQAALDKKEAELTAYEKSLTELKADIEKQQADLEAATQLAEAEDATFEGLRSGFSEEKLTELQQVGAIYSKMEATAAAAVMTQIYDAQQIALIIYYMQPAASALLLEKIDPGLAADVTKILTS